MGRKKNKNPQNSDPSGANGTTKEAGKIAQPTFPNSQQQQPFYTNNQQISQNPNMNPWGNVFTAASLQAPEFVPTSSPSTFIEPMTDLSNPWQPSVKKAGFNVPVQVNSKNYGISQMKLEDPESGPSLVSLVSLIGCISDDVGKIQKVSSQIKDKKFVTNDLLVQFLTLVKPAEDLSNIFSCGKSYITRELGAQKTLIDFEKRRYGKRGYKDQRGGYNKNIYAANHQARGRGQGIRQRRTRPQEALSDDEFLTQPSLPTQEEEKQSNYQVDYLGSHHDILLGAPIPSINRFQEFLTIKTDENQAKEGKDEVTFMLEELKAKKKKQKAHQQAERQLQQDIYLKQLAKAQLEAAEEKNRVAEEKIRVAEERRQKVFEKERMEKILAQQLAEEKRIKAEEKLRMDELKAQQLAEEKRIKAEEELMRQWLEDDAKAEAERIRLFQIETERIRELEELLACPFCYEQPEEDDNYELSCQHIVHATCFREYLKSQVDTGKCEFKCLKCLKLDVLQIAGPELMNRVFSNEFEVLIQGNSDFKNCSRPDCKGIGLVDEGAFECQTCNYRLCWTCKVPYEFGHICADYIQVIPNEEFKELIQQGLMRNCPGLPGQSCPQVIQKIEACNHMTCICGAEFCYKCGHPYVGAHNTCPCGQVF